MLRLSLLLGPLLWVACSDGTTQTTTTIPPGFVDDCDSEFEICEDLNQGGGPESSLTCSPTSGTTDHVTRGGIYPPEASINRENSISGWACDEDRGAAPVLVRLYYRRAGDTGQLRRVGTTWANLNDSHLTSSHLESVGQPPNLCGGVTTHKYSFDLSLLRSAGLQSGQDYELLLVGDDPVDCTDHNIGPKGVAEPKTFTMP